MRSGTERWARRSPPATPMRMIRDLTTREEAVQMGRVSGKPFDTVAFLASEEPGRSIGNYSLVILVGTSFTDTKREGPGPAKRTMVQKFSIFELWREQNRTFAR